MQGPTNIEVISMEREKNGQLIFYHVEN